MGNSCFQRQACSKINPSSENHPYYITFIHDEQRIFAKKLLLDFLLSFGLSKNILRKPDISFNRNRLIGEPLVEVSTLLQAGSCHIQVMDRVAANDKNFF